MSTIPSIFDAATPTYTAVGGSQRAASTGLSAALLNRGGGYPRRTQFQELEKLGFDNIISIEGPGERYDLEELSSRFPFVRFILLKEPITLGERINLAAVELSCPLFLTIWSDVRILYAGSAEQIIQRLFDTHAGEGQTRLCTVPVIQNSRYETLPTLSAPVFSRDTVGSIAFVPQREGAPSLYPFDGIGIYDREKFIRIGGFDGSLKNAHWQLMDFGFRSHLWGEDIQSTQYLRVVYNGEVPLEDRSFERSYRHFYLRNIAPVFRGDNAYLPWRRLFLYFLRTGGDPFQAWAEFSQERRWVKTHQYRYRRDARSLTDLWDMAESKGEHPQSAIPDPPPAAESPGEPKSPSPGPGNDTGGFEDDRGQAKP